jgi:RHS repeat-associated protein
MPWSTPGDNNGSPVKEPAGPATAEPGGDDRRIVRRFSRADALKRVTSIVSPYNLTDDNKPQPRTSYTYFDNGWVKSQSEEKFVRPTDTRSIKTHAIDYDYDPEGNQTLWRTNPEGAAQNNREVTRTFYPNGTLATRTASKPLGGAAKKTVRQYEYFYNQNNSLVQIDDYDARVNERDDPNPELGRKRTTLISRDAAERQTLVNETWPGGRDTLFRYDTAGNVEYRQTDGIWPGDNDRTVDPGENLAPPAGENAKETKFTYDALNREQAADVDAGFDGTHNTTRTTSTTWWPSGDMRTRTKPNGTEETRYYTARGELAQKIRDPQGAGLDTDKLTYHYDGDGNRETDERGDHLFNPRGQLVRWQRGSKYASSDAAKNKAGKIVTYTRNPAGETVDQTDTFRPPQITSDSTTHFQYHGERLRWTETKRSTAQGEQTQHSDYTYDDFGSVTKIVHDQDGPGADDPKEPADAPPVGVSCNELPNEAEKKITRYCFDEFERMVQSQGQGVDKPTVYVYDGLDRRDRSTVDENGNDPGGIKNHDYAYIGTSPQLSRETDKDGKQKTYDYDSDGRRLGQSVKTSTDTTFKPYATDGNGSVEGLEDPNGGFGDPAKPDTYLYDPYGESENVGTATEKNDPGLSDAAKDNPFRFEGFYYDSGVKTYDMQARNYRPDIGRFLSQDRYESAAGDELLQADPLTQNRYAFAGGNPVMNVEFDGHKLYSDGGHAGPKKRPRGGGGTRGARAPAPPTSSWAPAPRPVVAPRGYSTTFNFNTMRIGYAPLPVLSPPGGFRWPAVEQKEGNAWDGMSGYISGVASGLTFGALKPTLAGADPTTRRYQNGIGNGELYSLAVPLPTGKLRGVRAIEEGVTGATRAREGAKAGEEATTAGRSALAADEVASPTAPFGRPGPDYEWRGTDKGSWYNPKTGEYWHPDPSHPKPHGPHWDYRDPNGGKWRIYPDGRMEPKP